MTTAGGLFIDDTAVIEAYVWAIYLHRKEQAERPLRLLKDIDITNIQRLRTELRIAYNVEKEDNHSLNYHKWRQGKLDAFAKLHHWTPPTRNLYASILSILSGWERNGQSGETKTQLRLLYPGTSLLLPFLSPRFQSKLTGKGKRDVTPL